MILYIFIIIFLYNETKLSKYIDMQRQTNLLLVNIGDIYKSKLCV